MSIRSNLDANQAIRNSHDEATQSFVVLPINALIKVGYDNGSLSQTDTTDVYTFKSGVTTVATLTLTYTDSTKETLSTWAYVES